ncbi:MAG: hypothetical protein LBV60_08900 [Streptomyces sp.]|jgi:hypothetical protein|nr:hypothetical protein [Streptomyces sp.]
MNPYPYTPPVRLPEWRPAGVAAYDNHGTGPDGRRRLAFTWDGNVECARLLHGHYDVTLTRALVDGVLEYRGQMAVTVRGLGRMPLRADITAAGRGKPSILAPYSSPTAQVVLPAAAVRVDSADEDDLHLGMWEALDTAERVADAALGAVCAFAETRTPGGMDGVPRIEWSEHGKAELAVAGWTVLTSRRPSAGTEHIAHAVIPVPGAGPTSRVAMPPVSVTTDSTDPNILERVAADTVRASAALADATLNTALAVAELRAEQIARATGR